MKRYGTNFGYAITDKILEVTCEKCKASLNKQKNIGVAQ